MANKKSEYNRFRIAVKGGGCSGYQNKFSIDKCIESDDIILSSPEVAFEIVIDIHSFPLLEDITLDHTSSLAGENFFITNPNYTSQSMLKNEIAVLEERLKEISPKSSSGTTSDSINTTQATEAEVEKALSTPPPSTPTLGGVSVGAEEPATSDSTVVEEPLKILPNLDKGQIGLWMKF
jgi:iron-sulfur cluster insertion protein